MKIITIISMVFLVVLAGCAQIDDSSDKYVLHCTELGGIIHEERGFEGGEYNICTLPDGEECEVSALYKNVCGPNREVRHECSPEEKAAEMCTMDYTPVCGYTSPGAKVKTFGNGCGACADRLVGYWVEGEC